MRRDGPIYLEPQERLTHGVRSQLGNYFSNHHDNIISGPIFSSLYSTQSSLDQTRARRQFECKKPSVKTILTEPKLNNPESKQQQPVKSVKDHDHIRSFGRISNKINDSKFPLARIHERKESTPGFVASRIVSSLLLVAISGWSVVSNQNAVSCMDSVPGSFIVNNDHNIHHNYPVSRIKITQCFRA